MRARRVFAILIATPVLLAAIGVAGGSAVAVQKPASEGSSVRPKPTSEAESESRHGEAKRSADEETEPEEGLLGAVGGELLGRFSSRWA